MKSAVVVIGIGELGAVFAQGLLRLGHAVFPVTRAMPMAEVAQAVPDPALVLLAVGEADLHAALTAIPAAWRDRLALLQNELLPRDWEQAELEAVTIISVWFEKKPQQPIKVLLPSPIQGPQAKLLADSLQEVDIPTRVLATGEELLFELVRKNLYILTINIAGLALGGGTVMELWQQHESLARAVAEDVIALQEQLSGQPLDRESLLAGMLEAFDADPQHGCSGRRAAARLRRALEQADQSGLKVPTLREIAAKHLAEQV